MVSGEVEAKIRELLQLVERGLIWLCQASADSETDTKVTVDGEMVPYTKESSEPGTCHGIPTLMPLLLDEKPEQKQKSTAKPYTWCTLNESTWLRAGVVGGSTPPSPLVR